MSGLLYFISGISNAPTREQLEANGLIGETVSSTVEIMRFVDGSAGVMFTLKGKFKGEFYIGFRNDVQNWEQIPDTKLWVGYNLTDKPKPEDFLKDDFINGHLVKLGDGNDYTIPLARKFIEGMILPQEMVMYSMGKLQKVVVAKYASLQVIAEKIAVFCGLVTDKVKDVSLFDTDEKAFLLCAEILATNYNLGVREISVLRLFNTKNTGEIIKAVVDMPYILQLLEEENKDESKKKS